MDTNEQIDALIKVLQAFDAVKLSKLLIEFRGDIMESFESPPLKILLDDFFIKSQEVPLSQLTEEPSCILQIIALVNSLHYYIKNENNNTRIEFFEYPLRDSLGSLVIKLVSAAKNQINVLGNAINQIVETTQKIDSKGKSFVILEAPLGNSIPCMILLHQLQEKGVNAKIVSVSLNRNDSKSHGITRNEILKKITENNKDNIIIYFDEWVSGDNFNRLLTYLSKEKGFQLIPCAALTEESHNDEKYEKYVLFHDKICKKHELNGQELRFVFPKLNKIVTSIQKFVWAENDRLAGYRKLELAGSIYSTIQYTIEDFYYDEDKLKRLIPVVMKNDMKNEMIQTFTPILIESVKFYIEHFDSLLKDKINADFNPKTISNLEEEGKYLILLAQQVEGFDIAKNAIAFCIKYLHSNNINPYNRYYFQGKVPICEKLSGDELLLNAIFLKETLKLINEQST